MQPAGEVVTGDKERLSWRIPRQNRRRTKPASAPSARPSRRQRWRSNESIYGALNKKVERE